jgi:hypothetical protein
VFKTAKSLPGAGGFFMLQTFKISSVIALHLLNIFQRILHCLERFQVSEGNSQFYQLNGHG